MSEEWNEKLFNQDIGISDDYFERLSMSPAAINPRTLLAVIILLSTICCCIFGGCQ